MLTSVANVLHRAKWKSEQRDGRMDGKRGVLNPHPPMMMMMTAMKAVINAYNHRKTQLLSTQKPCIASLFRPRVLPIKEEDYRKLKRQQQF